MGYKVFDDKMNFARMELRETLEKNRSVEMTYHVKVIFNGMKRINR